MYVVGKVPDESVKILTTAQELERAAYSLAGEADASLVAQRLFISREACRLEKKINKGIAS